MNGGPVIRRVLVTRPAETSAELARLLAARDIEAVIAPMLAIEPVVPSSQPSESTQAALVTSANAVAGLASLDLSHDLPVYAVGDATAAAVREQGFTRVATAAGAGEDLVALVRARLSPAAGPLVWVAGEAVSVPVDDRLRASGFRVDRIVVYRSLAADRLPPEATRALVDGGVDAVLFFSPRTAEAFARLARRDGLDGACARLSAHCISDAVAGAASSLPWRAVHVAASPTRDDLLRTLVSTTAPGDEG